MGKYIFQHSQFIETLHMAKKGKHNRMVSVFYINSHYNFWN